MSMAVSSNSVSPYSYSNDLASGGSSTGNQTINEILQMIEAILMQMLNQNQNASSPSGDSGGGGGMGSGGGGGGGNAFAAAPPAAAAPSAAAPVTPSAAAPVTPSTTPATSVTPATPTASPTAAPAVSPSTAPANAPASVGGASTPGALSGQSTTQPPNSINVKDYGAKGDGTTDDQAAIQSAINAGQASGKTVWFPPGTYNHSNVLNANGVNIQGAGSGTVLNATNPSEEAIKLGNNSSLSNLETSTSAGSRDSQPDEAAVDVTGSGDSVSHVTTLGAESNGIRLDGATGAKISSNLVEGSNADGIALMNGSSNNTVSGNEVYQAGDDSYSDDSYTSDRAQDSGNVFSQDMSLDNSYGRSFALMGATGDTVKNSVSDGSKWMGIVAGTDSNSQTLAGSNDTIANNLITNSNGDAVDVMGAGGSLSQSGAGMDISGNSTSGSAQSVLGFDPVADLTQRGQINAAYQPGTGNGANNGS